MNASPADTAVSEFVMSPNQGERPQGACINTLLLHYTGLREDKLNEWISDPFGEALRWLINPQAEVSSHYIVDLDGRIVQLVPEARRAWHAGRGSWKDCNDINSCSIGIEIVNTGHTGGLPAYPKHQIASVITLCKDIVARRGIAAERVLAHSDIAPARKADPGEHFPWNDLFHAGVGHWVQPVAITQGARMTQGDCGESVSSLQMQLARYGYGIAITGSYDEPTLQCVRAFQRHFRPDCVDGIADISTQATLDSLLASLPGQNCNTQTK